MRCKAVEEAAPCCLKKRTLKREEEKKMDRYYKMYTRLQRKYWPCEPEKILWQKAVEGDDKAAKTLGLLRELEVYRDLQLIKNIGWIDLFKRLSHATIVQ